MARKGYCASLKRWYIGVREHLFFTLDGRLAFMVQVAGNRHDTQGLYALLKTAFQGALLADNGYWPSREKREELESMASPFWPARGATRSSGIRRRTRRF